MIVIRAIDLMQGRVEIEDLGRPLPTWNSDLLHLAERARQVGMRELVVRQNEELRTHALFENEPTLTRVRTGRTTAVQEEYLLVHSWRVVDEWPVYEARFKHVGNCLPQLSSYCAVLLSSYGHQSTHLMQMRLALYEVCANVVEHGLRGHSPGEIDIQLRFCADGIEGWVQDGCEPFDPSTTSLSPLPESVANRRARGYGLHIIRQLLDDLAHEYNDTGNRITFKKRITR